MTRTYLLVVLAGAVACTKQSTPGPSDATSSTREVAKKSLDLEVVELPTPVKHYVINKTTLRLTPTEDGEVADPFKPGEKTNNWVGNLMRTEEVQVLATAGDWAQVEQTSGAEGWVVREHLVEAKGLFAATVLGDTPTFNRDDPSALNEARVIQAGTLLYVESATGPFAKLYFDGPSPVWVKTETLMGEDDDIAVSRMITELRWSKAHDEYRGPSYRFVTEARGQHRKTRLMEVLVREAGNPDE